MKQKIIVTVRTLNEEKNIDRFCQCYEWADEILVADGGSTDETKDRALRYRNVRVYNFPFKATLPDGTFYNPRGKHINFLIDRAHYYDADWIIFDDCDCVPTVDLQEMGRDIIERSFTNDYVYAYRMFVLGQDYWFPDMTPDQSLWAWRAVVPIRADIASYTISMKIPDAPTTRLPHPYSLLHYFYPDEETLQKKKSQYVQTGEVLDDYNPKVQFGRVVNLPDWARWR